MKEYSIRFNYLNFIVYFERKYVSMWRRHIPSLVEKNLTTTSSAPLHFSFFFKMKNNNCKQHKPQFLKKGEGCSG